MYLRIKNKVLCEFIPEIDPLFPDIPIESRYSADFLFECIVLDDISELRTGMLYDPETGAFSEPPAPDPVPEPQPEPTPEPAPQTLDDQLTAAIEKGLSL